MNLTNLNQKIILQTGIFGIFLGISSTLGWCQEKEIYILIVMIFATIIYLKKKLNKNLLIHSLIIGLSWGFDCSLVQVIFMNTFLYNNLSYANEIALIPNINSRLLLITIGLFWGIVSGITIWIFVYLSRKLRI